MVDGVEMSNSSLHHAIIGGIVADGHAPSRERLSAPFGDIRPVDQIRQFSREWYGQHLNTDWRRWTVTEASEMFARHGLEGPISTLQATRERF